MDQKFTLCKWPARLLLFALVTFSAWVNPAKAQVDVTATAGTATASYTNLSSAFTAINAGTHQGNIIISVTASFTDVASAVLQGSGTGTAVYTSVLIHPTNDGVTISYPAVVGRGVIELNGADNVTIDGDNPNTVGTNRNLTIANTAAATINYTSVVRIATGTGAGYTDANNIMVKNCILNGNATGRNSSGTTSTTGPENTTFGIYAGGNGGATITAISSVTTNSAATTTTINALVIDNNTVNQCARGIVFNGAGVAVSTGVTITNNLVGDQGALTTYPFTAPATTVYTKGIWVAGTNSIVITGNTVKNIISYVGTLMTGIELNSGIGTGQINISNNTLSGIAQNSTATNKTAAILVSSAGAAYTISNNTISNVRNQAASSTNPPVAIEVAVANSIISKNKISSILSHATGAYTATGIWLNGGDNHQVQNNYISDVNVYADNTVTSTSFLPSGIKIAAGNTHKIYNNSVHLFGPPMGGANPNGTACITFVSGAGSGSDIRNNILSNQFSGWPAGSVHACILIQSGLTSAFNLTCNNNAYYAGTGNFVAQLSSGTTYTVANFSAAATTPATNWRAYSSTLSAAGTNDNASIASNAAPPFVSSTDLHINIGAANALDLDGKAAPIVGLTTDYDGDARNATTPDIGADEFTVPMCAGAVGGTAAPATATICSGQSAALTVTGATAGLGITYQWEVSATGGGAGFSNVSAGTGATTTSYNTGALTPGTYYFRLNVTCSTGPVTGYSNEVTVTVNALPTVGVTPTTATLCMPAPAATLTATGGVSYTWAPAGGLSATTGASVSALPGSTTTYTVTGTDAAGCTNTATSTISVSSKVFVTSVTATPPNVCSGGTTTLAATAVNTTNYTVSSIPYAPETDPGGASLLSGDDAMSAAVTIPFDFSYYGVSYNQLFLCSNGFVQLGTSSGSTGVYAQNIPAAAIPNNIIAGVWSDLNINSTTGGVRTYTTGTAGSQVFTIHYYGIAYYSSSVTYTGSVEFYISLFEADGHIEVHVTDATGVSTTTANKTLGIENNDGTAAVTPAGRNAANWSVTGGTHEAWKFAPSGGTFTYTWSETPSSGTLTSTTTNPTTATNILVNETYTVIASDPLGCTGTGNTNVVAGAALVCTSISMSSPSTCAGNNLTLTSNRSGGGAPYSYAWNDGVGGVYTDTSSIVVNLPAGTYNFSVTVTDACGSSCTSNQTVVIDPTPTASISGVSSPLCATETISFTGTTDVGTSFNWTGPNSFSSTSQNPASFAATTSASGTYNFTATLGACTSAPATFALTVNPSPITVTATPNMGSLCIGDTLDLAATANDYGFLINENFNAAPAGWTTVNNSTGGTPANAAWTLQASPHTPGGSWTSPANIISSNDNTQFYFTNGDAPGSGSTTNTILQTPAFSTIGFTAVTLNMFHYYRDIADAGDNAYIEVSTDGTAWTTIQTYTTDQGAPTAFANPIINLDAYAGNATVYVRFRYSGTWDWGWAIDNVVITGSPSSYSYSWVSVPAGFTSTDQNPADIVPSATADYTVTATNMFNCSLSATATVVVNSLPTVTASSDAAGDTACEGSDVTLTGSGATSYTWDNGVTDGVAFAATSTLTYHVIGTDANGCEDADSITVTVNSLPTVTASSDATGDAVCEGSDVTLTAGGATSYVWDNSVTDGVAFTPASTLTYNVTGTDANGCENTASITITVNVVDATTSTAAATITANSATGTYQWINCATNLPIAGETNQSYTATANGDYAVIVTDNGCSDTSDCVTITGLGLNQFGKTVFALYPNPTSGSFTIESTTDGQFTLVSSLGDVVMNGKLNTGKNTFNTGEVARGIYLVKIADVNGNQLNTQRLTITK